MKNTLLKTGLLVAMLGCVCGATASLTADAEGTADWIKITQGSKRIYTVDANGAEGVFNYNAGNNAHQVDVIVDLGEKADGTEEDVQVYMLSAIQFANLVNTSAVTVSTSLDGVTYTPVLEEVDPAGEWKVITFEQEVKTRFVKLESSAEWTTYWGAEYPVAFLGYGMPDEVAPETPVVPSVTRSWLDINNTSKYVYTVDGEGNEADFVYGAANNVHQKDVIIDLGKKADGSEDTQKLYGLSKIKFRSAQNVTEVDVAVSLDKIHWTTVIDGGYVAGEAAQEHVTLDFNKEVVGRYVKISVVNAWGTFWHETYTFSLVSYEKELSSITADNFKMLGASIRVGEGVGDGIRFGVVIEKNLHGELLALDATMGMLLIPNTLVEGNLTVDTANVANVTIANEKWVELTAEDGTVYMQTTVCLWDIPESAYAVEVRAAGYICLDGVYNYTATIDRSIKTVAQAAYDDAKTTEEVKALLEKYLAA